MWFPVSTIATIFVLFDVHMALISDNQMELVFRDRSKSDWQDVWHQEKYVRCRETLLRHLYWACEKDIYRLTRRSDPTFPAEQDDEEYPWLPVKRAKTFLRFRRNANRRGGSSITAECCKSTGCTWEEYAEYCPTNKRHTSFISSFD